MNIKHIGTCESCKRDNAVLQMVFEFGELERLLKQPPSLKLVCPVCETNHTSLKDGISNGLDVKLSPEDRKQLLVWRASLLVPIRESHMGKAEYSIMSQEELFAQIDAEKKLDPNHVITLKNFVRRGGVTTVSQLDSGRALPFF
jgi:hypothetical protein